MQAGGFEMRQIEMQSAVLNERLDCNHVSPSSFAQTRLQRRSGSAAVAMVVDSSQVIHRGGVPLCWFFAQTASSMVGDAIHCRSRIGDPMRGLWMLLLILDPQLVRIDLWLSPLVF